MRLVMLLLFADAPGPNELKKLFGSRLELQIKSFLFKLFIAQHRDLNLLIERCRISDSPGKTVGSCCRRRARYYGLASTREATGMETCWSNML